MTKGEHMSTQPEALRLAKELDAYHTAAHHKQAAAELRRLHAANQALAEQPEQEPVAIVAVDGVGQIQVGWITKPQHNDKLYTSPPQRTEQQPAVPDAIYHTDLSETLEYITGWNDCRAEMLRTRGQA